MAPFTELLDLASERLGGAVIHANDDFFAPKENLLKHAAAVFLEHEYTDRGKWMDGWESRRKRGPGHDFCVVRLGRPGVIHALEIDTRHFTGNYPPRASVDFVVTDERNPSEGWQPLLAMMILKGDTRHPLIPPAPQFATHLRLNIFPD